MKGPGGARRKGLPEPHVVAHYSLMVAERAAVLVFQDDQLLLRTGDHLEQVGRGGPGHTGLNAERMHLILLDSPPGDAVVCCADGTNLGPLAQMVRAADP